MGVVFKHKGSFKNTEKFLRRAENLDYAKLLSKYGEEGVRALSAATPVDTGRTAASWYYEIKFGKDAYEIEWTNSNVNNGVNIAVILQFGHGTRNGGYVRGRDYINPALRPVFDKFAEELWGEVTK